MSGLRRWAVVVWALFAGLVGLRCFGPATGVVASVAVLAGRVARRPWQRRRALATYDDELVGLLRAVARGLRSGAVLRVALRDAATVARGPLADDLARLAADLDGGVVAALAAWPARRPRAAVRLTAGGLALGHATGGVTAAVVDALADTISVELDGRDEAAALSTQANLSAVLLAALPVGFVVVGAIGRSGSSAFLFGEAAGRLCLAAGLLLDTLALGAMVLLSRRALR